MYSVEFVSKSVLDLFGEEAYEPILFTRYENRLDKVEFI